MEKTSNRIDLRHGLKPLKVIYHNVSSVSQALYIAHCWFKELRASRDKRTVTALELPPFSPSGTIETLIAKSLLLQTPCRFKESPIPRPDNAVLCQVQT